MKFLTIGKVNPEHVAELYSRFMNSQPVKGVKVMETLMEADGHRFFIYHDSDTTEGMAEMSGRYDDICDFQTFPVRTGDEIVASLKK